MTNIELTFIETIRESADPAQVLAYAVSLCVDYLSKREPCQELSSAALSESA